jgi:hypothetical protein
MVLARAIALSAKPTSNTVRSAMPRSLRLSGIRFMVAGSLTEWW